MIPFGNWRSSALRMACFIAPLVYVGCLLVPVRNRLIDLLMLGSLLAAWVGWLIALRGRPLKLAVWVMAGLLPVALLCLPSRPDQDVQKLAAVNVQSLQRYTGTTYWWGGETSLGIDCSGLVRAAMMDACLREGIRIWNGGLLRHALDLWWHDESAQALGEGYRNLTVPISAARTLNGLNDTAANIGDLAIAGDGIHVLAYLGEKHWIQADPDAGKVIIETAPSKNAWMNSPVKIVRWTILAAAKGE
jgi:NlpC/P60 family protein